MDCKRLKTGAKGIYYLLRQDVSPDRGKVMEALRKAGHKKEDRLSSFRG